MSRGCQHDSLQIASGWLLRPGCSCRDAVAHLPTCRCCLLLPCCCPGSQSGDWVLLLEGLCRISVQRYANSSASDPYDLVAIAQLELAPPQSNLVNGATPGAWTGTPDGGSDAASQQEDGADAAEVAELGRQLKASTQQLLKLLSQQTGLPTVVRRLLELLEAVPPWRAADVVAAALGRNTQVGGCGCGQGGGGYCLFACLSL